MTKILIVDDDITITELMKALVKMEGHEPTTVNNSLQAMEIANLVKPDLITLDLMMPGLTGRRPISVCHQRDQRRLHERLIGHVETGSGADLLALRVLKRGLCSSEQALDFDPRGAMRLEPPDARQVFQSHRHFP